jgi:hypothetical protein
MHFGTVDRTDLREQLDPEGHRRGQGIRVDACVRVDDLA